MTGHCPQREPHHSHTIPGPAIAPSYSTSISEKEIVGTSRKKELVEARQIAAYLGREILGSSLSNIGIYLGGRDHTTILHACKNIETKIGSEKRIKKLVNSIRTELSASII